MENAGCPGAGLVPTLVFDRRCKELANSFWKGDCCNGVVEADVQLTLDGVLKGKGGRSEGGSEGGRSDGGREGGRSGGQGGGTSVGGRGGGRSVGGRELLRLPIEEKGGVVGGSVGDTGGGVEGGPDRPSEGDARREKGDGR